MLEALKEPSAWGAVVSFAAMVVSVGFSLAAIRRAKRSLEHQRQLVRMERFRLEQEQRERVKAWADEVLGLMQRGIDHAALSQEDESWEADRIKLAGKLSEQIDRGRWLFENVKNTGYGIWKESAYQGFRPGTLDVVLEAYNLVRPSDGAAEALDRKTLIDTKRRFVSEIQTLVKPSRARDRAAATGGRIDARGLERRTRLVAVGRGNDNLVTVRNYVCGPPWAGPLPTGQCMAL